MTVQPNWNTQLLCEVNVDGEGVVRGWAIAIKLSDSFNTTRLSHKTLMLSLRSLTTQPTHGLVATWMPWSGDGGLTPSIETGWMINV